MRPTGMTPMEQLQRMDRGRAGTSKPGRVTRSRDELVQQVEALDARVAQLEGALKDSEGFAALAAHELVAPLLMAETFAGLVGERLDERKHAASRRDLDAVSRTAARTRRLVEALLREARSSDGLLRREHVELDALVADAVTSLAPEIERRQARVEVAGPLPAVVGEPDLLAAVMGNLLVNALKYNPRQGGTVRVSAERRDGWCTVHVDDEAPQISVEERERIFAPYQRGRNERRIRGSGLGLTICRRIVERHGGTIAVTAAPTGGNRFTFVLAAT